MNGGGVWGMGGIGKVGKTIGFRGKARGAYWSGMGKGHSYETSYTWACDDGGGLEFFHKLNRKQNIFIKNIIHAHKESTWSLIIQMITFNAILFFITNKIAFVIWNQGFVIYHLAHVHM